MRWRIHYVLAYHLSDAWTLALPMAGRVFLHAFSSRSRMGFQDVLAWSHNGRFSRWR